MNTKLISMLVGFLTILVHARIALASVEPSYNGIAINQETKGCAPYYFSSASRRPGIEPGWNWYADRDEAENSAAIKTPIGECAVSLTEGLSVIGWDLAAVKTCCEQMRLTFVNTNVTRPGALLSKDDRPYNTTNTGPYLVAVIVVGALAAIGLVTAIVFQRKKIKKLPTIGK